MTKKDEIIRLKQMNFKNSDIALLLNVSRQYVSHVYRDSQRLNKQTGRARHGQVVNTGRASRLLGVSESTIRRWADQGKIPCFRIKIGRGDRHFILSEIEKLKGSP